MQHGTPTQKSSYCPPFVVAGEVQEQWAIDIDTRGFVQVLHRKSPTTDWWEAASFPSKVAAHIDTFISQNYRVLDNAYGIPKDSGAAIYEVKNVNN